MLDELNCQSDCDNQMLAKTVLVVDDEQEIRDSVSRWLSFSGFRVVHANDGIEGIAAAIEHSPDAIILDMLMPRMDGLTALSELVKDDRTQSIPVVMLSASLREEQRTLDAGATFFVHKPYEGKHLVRVVHAAIETKQPASAKVI